MRVHATALLQREPLGGVSQTGHQGHEAPGWVGLDEHSSATVRHLQDQGWRLHHPHAGHTSQHDEARQGHGLHTADGVLDLKRYVESQAVGR